MSRLHCAQGVCVFVLVCHREAFTLNDIFAYHTAKFDIFFYFNVKPWRFCQVQAQLIAPERKKNSYSMWLKTSLAQVHATAPGRLSYSFKLHTTKKVCLRGLKIKAQYRQGLRNKTDFKSNVFGNEIIFVGKRFVRAIFYDDKTRIISNVSESAAFQNQQRFRIRNVSESEIKIRNGSAISNVSELKRGGHRMASFDELKIGLSVDAYWPYTGSFYAAVVTICNGKCAVVFFCTILR